MRGCEKHGFGFECFVNYSFDYNVLFVHIDWNGFKICSIECFGCIVISWVFDEDVVIGVE
ncbi:hypothetical protein DQE84_16200 [Staphylococcus warneri]|nr:hypothetical protein DQE84_16200 [Staphylococcus warneri]